MSMSKMPPNKPKYQEGEKILCYHGPLIYEGKCQQFKYEEKDKSYHYFIHYSGWNKNWDEWVPEWRVLQHNEANQQKQAELKKVQKAEEKKIKKKKSTTGKEKKDEEDEPDRKKKRTKQDTGNATLLTTINIKIDNQIKDLLVEDWSRINHDKKLVKIPSSETIDQLVLAYINDKKKKESKEDISMRREVANGIREYFNVMIGTQLLYDNERDQYDDILDKFGEDENMSSIYGGVHLMRMFTRLGSAMGYTKFDEISTDFLVGNVNDFLAFLTAKASSIFSPDNYISDTDMD